MNLKALENSTILIVDDNISNLKMLLTSLENYNCDISVAMSGEEAIKRVESLIPNIILLDIMMPGIDGYETCRRLKENETTKDIPIIFMTILNETVNEVKGFELGAVDYIAKPIQLEKVLVRISTHLEIQRQKDELAKLNATKDRFFSIIAHDLRGPFASILGYAEILPDSVKTGNLEEIQLMVTEQSTALKNLYKLVENLLDWSQLQRGKMKYSPSQISIYAIAFQNTQLYKTRARHKNIEVLSIINEAATAFADANMVDMIVRNLINNALKFTNPGGKIVVSAKSNNTNIEISVTDNGIGLTDMYKEKLFRIETKFRTTGTAGETGTGLGLILCKELVEKNKGKIWVKSEFQKGSTFKFTLPCAPA
jgi:signal transduction histidine kinase